MQVLHYRRILLLVLALLSKTVAWMPGAVQQCSVRSPLGQNRAANLGNRRPDRVACRMGPDATPSTESFSDTQRAELVEVAFLQSCLSLSQGFVDILKLFVAAVKAHYELDTEVNSVVSLVNEAPSSAGRDLTAEEIALRSQWIQMVYLILEFAESGATPNGEDKLQSRYQPILEPMRLAHSKRESLNVNKFYQLVQRESDTETDRALVSQTLKVAWYTFVVLEEEELANRDNANKPPTPRGEGFN